LKKTEEYDNKMNEIKSTIHVDVPTELKNLFPIIYHLHIFSFIKRIETYKRNLIMKFKDIKNEINYIVWKYNQSSMNARVKNRLEFISGVKVKLKEELLYYKNAYGIMEDLLAKEIQRTERIEWFLWSKRNPISDNPVVSAYLATIFEDD
jgi:hypothetical protein